MDLNDDADDPVAPPVPVPAPVPVPDDDDDDSDDDADDDDDRFVGELVVKVVVGAIFFLLRSSIT